MSTDGLARLNALPRDEAVAELLQCCGARAWAEAMADARPFPSRAALMETADEVWSRLGRADRLEAFRAHPRIGERAAPAAAAAGAARAGPPDRHAQWSEQEQAGARTADAETLRELAHLNQAYEERFGHVFLICATGLDAATMLQALRARIHNDPDEELRIASKEQRRITRIRLEKLL